MANRYPPENTELMEPNFLAWLHLQVRSGWAFSLRWDTARIWEVCPTSAMRCRDFVESRPACGRSLGRFFVVLSDRRRSGCVLIASYSSWSGASPSPRQLMHDERECSLAAGEKTPAAIAKPSGGERKTPRRTGMNPRSMDTLLAVCAIVMIVLQIC